MLLTALALLALQGPSADAAPEAPARPLLDSVAVLGASLSFGHGLAQELVLPEDAPLGRFLACAFDDGAATFHDLGDTWFFRNPIAKGRAQVDAALALEPTLVVALDFLFWYGFGNGYVDDDARLADLERGLEQLGRFECPIVIGDLPDITVALDGKGPFGQPLVTRDMIPNDVALRRLNVRLAYWMAEHPRVSMVPIGELLTRLRAGEKINLRGNEWQAAALSEALQPDLLHPTVRGTRWVALATLDVLARAHPTIAEKVTSWSEQAHEQRLLAATADEREKEQARRERRDERRRRADERRRKAEGGDRRVPAVR